MTNFHVPETPSLAFVCSLDVATGAPVDLGIHAQGRRRFVPVTGGSLSGPLLSGHILSSGGDWQTSAPDGVIELAARYALELNDGTRLEFDNRGVRHNQSVTAEQAGYFHTTARITAPPGPHEWLTRTLFVAPAVRRTDRVCLNLFAVGVTG